MRLKTILVVTVVLGIAAIVLPVYAHQGHSLSSKTGLVAVIPSAQSRTAEVTMYVTHQDNHLETSAYRIEIPASDLDDARNRFLHDHVINGVYQFVQTEKDGEHLYLIERTQVVQTRIHMKQ